MNASDASSHEPHPPGDSAAQVSSVAAHEFLLTLQGQGLLEDTLGVIPSLPAASPMEPSHSTGARTLGGERRQQAMTPALASIVYGVGYRMMENWGISREDMAERRGSLVLWT